MADNSVHIKPQHTRAGSADFLFHQCFSLEAGPAEGVLKKKPEIIYQSRRRCERAGCGEFLFHQCFSLEPHPAQQAKKKKPVVGPPRFELESTAPQAARIPSYPTGPSLRSGPSVVNILQSLLLTSTFPFVCTRTLNFCEVQSLRALYPIGGCSNSQNSRGILLVTGPWLMRSL